MLKGGYAASSNMQEVKIDELELLHKAASYLILKRCAAFSLQAKLLDLMDF